MKDLVLEHRSPETPVVIGRDVAGAEESVRVVTLGELEPSEIDMRTLLIVGSSMRRSSKPVRAVRCSPPRGATRSERRTAIAWRHARQPDPESKIRA